MPASASFQRTAEYQLIKELTLFDHFSLYGAGRISYFLSQFFGD